MRRINLVRNFLELVRYHASIAFESLAERYECFAAARKGKGAV